jgi:hypothetical protein
MKRFLNYVIFILFLICLGTPIFGQESLPKPSFTNPAYTDMTIEAKRSSRTVMLRGLLTKYNQNKTFPKMYQYMELKYKSFKRKDTPPEPDQLITETLDKTRSVFDKVKSTVGNKFKHQYNPEIIEANVNKYLWLKGICFLVLGIGEEHKIAVSYFYQPENEKSKREFMVDIAKYSFPEVHDTPENAVWFNQMGQVMDRIAYKVFNVKHYEAKQ